MLTHFFWWTRGGALGYCRYEWPNSAALARDIKWKTKTDLSNLFKKKADCVNAHIGALLQPNRDALAIGGLKKDYMLRMVNNESVVGKSFDRIMHILGLAGDQRGTAAASEPLILDFGCEFYAQEKEATAKHAHALDALEEGRIQDARRGIEVFPQAKNCDSRCSQPEKVYFSKKHSVFNTWPGNFVCLVVLRSLSSCKAV